MKTKILIGFTGATFAGLLLILACGGCAYLHSVTSATTDEWTNRVERTTVRCYTLFDSQSALAQFKNTAGGKTMGTSMGSLNQAAQTTNAVSVIEAVARGVAAGLTKP